MLQNHHLGKNTIYKFFTEQNKADIINKDTRQVIAKKSISEVLNKTKIDAVV